MLIKGGCELLYWINKTAIPQNYFETDFFERILDIELQAQWCPKRWSIRRRIEPSCLGKQHPYVTRSDAASLYWFVFPSGEAGSHVFECCY
jgi:hypothetical protein